MLSEQGRPLTCEISLSMFHSPSAGRINLTDDLLLKSEMAYEFITL